jgi:hypothetical protein
MLPVLVGKSPALPRVAARTDAWANLFVIFAAMALPVVLIALFLPRLYRHQEDRHARLMDQFRKRRDETLAANLELSQEGSAAQASPVSAQQVTRLKKGLSWPEWN